MTPSLLRTFLAVMKHRNFRRAATEINLSQPAVTRHIQQLEESLGVRLFDRIGRSTHPTEAGEELSVDAERLLGDLSRVAERMTRFQSPHYGRLRLGASTTPGLYVLPPILGRFRLLHPKVEFSYAVSNSADVTARLLSNEIDLGFIGDEPRHPAIAVEATAADELVCVAHADHPLAQRQRIRIQQLLEETWVVRDRGSATRQLCEGWLRARNVTLQRTIELHHPEEVKALVRAGVGITIITIHALAAESTSSASIQRLSLAGLKLHRQLRLIRHRDKQLSPAMQSFVQECRRSSQPLHSHRM